jgi:hypothetical protein
MLRLTASFRRPVVTLDRHRAALREAIGIDAGTQDAPLSN